jgi:aldose 1-epimerase
VVLFSLPCAVLNGCGATPVHPMQYKVENFGATGEGEARLHELRNRNGLIARVTDFGAALVEMHVPDRHGEVADVVLGFADVAGYRSPANQYFGCTAGRVANRIAKGVFDLDGETYRLATNNGPNHLHGGTRRSLDKVLWRARPVDDPAGPAIEFSYRSPHLEEGYPGTLDTTVRYTLTEQNELRLDYTATTDRRTPVNLTNHAYWNLGGAGSGTILDHEITIKAASYTPTDDTLIPTGTIAPVAGTPLDLRQPTRIGARIDALAATAAQGFDHNFVLDPPAGLDRVAAVLHHPASGRVLEIRTTEPGLQFYSGNFLRGDQGKAGRTYLHRGALCLEAQHFPDTPHHETFPSIILDPGTTYRQTTVHRFTTR